jgi:hypothetical protein
MPKNKSNRRLLIPAMMLSAIGTWVPNKFAGMRVTKGEYKAHVRGSSGRTNRRTHTTPVVRTPENDGHNNPTRMRHAATKARHAARRDSELYDTMKKVHLELQENMS